MENQITLHAERVLKPIDPKLARDIKRLVTIHSVNPKTIAAIDSLIAIVENCRSFGVRTRGLKKRTIRSLLVLAGLTYNAIKLDASCLEFHRSKFADLLSNDYNILQYWGFIIPGNKKGYWRITQEGLNFLTGSFSCPAYVTCCGGARRGNYIFQEGVQTVCVWDFVKPSEVFAELRIPAAAAMYKLPVISKRLPQGCPLPTLWKVVSTSPSKGSR